MQLIYHYWCDDDGDKPVGDIDEELDGESVPNPRHFHEESGWFLIFSLRCCCCCSALIRAFSILANLFCWASSAFLALKLENDLNIEGILLEVFDIPEILFDGTRGNVDTASESWLCLIVLRLSVASGDEQESGEFETPGKVDFSSNKKNIEKKLFGRYIFHINNFWWMCTCVQQITCKYFKSI